MKMNKQKIIVSTLALAMGAALAGSVSGTVAWYQYSTRATTSYVGTSAKCGENLQISLDGTNFKSELLQADFSANARADKKGADLKPITFGETTTSGTTNAADPASDATKPYKHPKYQNFAYNTWGTADANSYLQYDLYFRVLDVDGAATPVYIAKKLYFEDFTLNFTPTNGEGSTTAFKDALRVQFDQVTPDGAKRILLSNTARDAMKLGAKLDLNGDGNYDKTKAYEWDAAPVETVYGDASLTQTTEAYSAYVSPVENGSLNPGETKSLGTTVAGSYSSGTALHFVVTVWLEGWDATGETAGTSIWDAKDYIGSFQLGMTFGITDYGQE